MKNFVFVSLFVLCSLVGNAQHYEVLDAEELWNSGVQTSYYCSTDDELLGIIVYGVGNYCSDQVWWLQDFSGILIDGINADSIVISNPHEYHEYQFTINGCYDIGGIPLFELTHSIIFDVLPLNPFDELILWKRYNDVITLSAPWIYSPVWSPGGNAPSIEALEQGVYSVTLTNECGSAIYSVEVRDNVEIYRATCDLATNKNQVTWHTTPEQAEYITSVKVYRNNELVGTVPYTGGVFTDNMGSENTQWQYHIVGVSVEGEDCPIPSYWKRTIHLDHVQGTQGDHILQWTPYAEESPEKSEVTAYRIFDVVNGVPTQVIDVGSFTNVYTYNPADFHGYGVVAAVFADEKGLEELAFSNLTKEMLSVDEISAQRMMVYPNPANGTFTVECTSNLTVYNTIGQVIATILASENGIHRFSLGTGVYFIKSDEGLVQKIVVE